MENWATLPHPNLEFTIEGFTLRSTITIFYDKSREDGDPTYVHKNKMPEDRRWEITWRTMGNVANRTWQEDRGLLTNPAQEFEPGQPDHLTYLATHSSFSEKSQERERS